MCSSADKTLPLRTFLCHPVTFVINVSMATKGGEGVMSSLHSDFCRFVTNKPVSSPAVYLCVSGWGLPSRVLVSVPVG